MLEFEIESKFEVLRNFNKLERIISKLASIHGFKIVSSETRSHVDVYIDNKMSLLKSGYTLRRRYVNSELKDITLKSIGTVDEGGIIRIEEKATQVFHIKKKLIQKLKTIYQAPKDESVYQILTQHELFKPVIIITKERRVLTISKNSHFCEVCFDKFSYLLPLTNGVYIELEIEGSTLFDGFRELIDSRLVKGRWPSLKPLRISKFERGMRIGGLM